MCVSGKKAKPDPDGGEREARGTAVEGDLQAWNPFRLHSPAYQIR